MKRRILSMLLVLCMVIGLLPMTAFAATKPNIKFYLRPQGSAVGGTIESGTTKYYTTDTNKKLVEWTGGADPTDNDSYIKVDYPAGGDEAIVYVTMNNINIMDNKGWSPDYYVIHFYEGAYAVVLTLKGQNSIELTGQRAGIRSDAANGLTITGDGSLTFTSTTTVAAIHMRKKLTIKDTNLTFNCPYSGSYHNILLDGHDDATNNLIIEGSTISSTVNKNSFVFFGKKQTNGNQGGSNPDDGSLEIKRTLKIKDSTITVNSTTSNYAAITTPSPVEISNSTVTVTNGSYSSTSNKLIRSGLVLGEEGTYTAVVADNINGDNATPYTGSLLGYRYIKIEPATAQEDPDPTDPVVGKPFYTVNWSGEYTSDFDYVYDMPFIYSPANVKEDVLDVSWNGARTIPALAQALKKEFDARPDGTRYFNFAALANAMRPNHELYLYHEKIMGLTKAWLEEFLAEYKRIGGKLDGIILDVEFAGARIYDLKTNMTADERLAYYEEVVAHPSYTTTLRPLLEERGFKFWPNSTKPEIYGIDSNSGSTYAQCRQIWDVVYRNRLSIYLNDAVTTPLLNYYPDAVVSDYQTHNSYGWQKRVDDNGAVITGGNYITAGNASNFNSYGFRPTNNFFTSSGSPRYVKIPAFNKAEFKNTSFNQTLYDIKLYKDLYVSDPNNRINVWICAYNYNSKAAGTTYCNSPYYSELLYHIGMLDPQQFLGYITSEINSVKGEVVNDIMGELTRVAGYADREPILIPTTWNDSFLLSGMYAGGRNIWRLTPDLTNGMTLNQFRVAGATDPTFVIDGQTITFPGGRIIADGSVTQVGTCGYWIETDKDVMPQVTNAVNRYQEYPAFAETYEAYEAGIAYTASAALPTNTWELTTGTNGTATIQTVSGNKVLAMKGTNTLKNVKMPQNITAGDTYAKVQTWEVTVTVPAGMASDATVVALNVFSSSSTAAEGGFKIAGGKVYYANAANYVVLSGVDVSAGGTFTFKREVDFTQAYAFKSNYSVYDSTGKLLAEAKNIPMKTVTIPVQRIGLKVSNVTGNPVLFDNYKLYASGVAADFELYDADTGIQVTDITEARATDTAYRLSWMNATSTEKKFTVVAAYYNGETLVSEKIVKEIEMLPGTDAVDCDIVKNEEGKTLKVYLKEIQEHTHTGGTATCKEKAVCTVCGQSYGEVNPANHAGGTRTEGATTGNCGETGYTGNTFCEGCNTKIATGSVIPATGNHAGGTATCEKLAECKVCGKEYGTLAACKPEADDGDCTTAIKCSVCKKETTPANATHTGGTATCKEQAVCTECQQPYGEVNPDNHAGGTRTEGAITGNCGEAGYTGDTYCEGCNTKIATGTVIPATGNHTGGTATCKEQAICTECQQPYGELNPDNHAGGTRTEGAITGNCGEAGYTGDTYCEGCDAKIGTGTEIPATNAHSICYTSNGNKTHTVTCANCTVVNSVANCSDQIGNDHLCDLCGAKLMDPVASVNGVEYETLAEAIKNAANGSEIVLYKDSVGEGLIIDKNVTINFNGKTYIIKTVAEGVAAVKITAEVKFTGNGKLDLVTANRENFGVLILNYGTLTTDNVVLNGTWLYNGDESWVVKNVNTVETTAKATFNAGTEILTSWNGNSINAEGTFKTEIVIDAPAGYCWNEGVLGAHNLVEKVEAKYLKDKATINTYAVYYKSCADCGARSEVTFEYVEGGKLDNYVATVTFNGVSANYATLEEAIENAAAGSEIVLHKDSVGEGLSIDKNITINFNGYSYIAKTAIGDTKAAIKINEGAKVTIKGSGVLDLLTANREKFGVLVLNKGELTTDNIVLNGTWLYNGNESWVVKNEGDKATATFDADTEILTSAKGNGNLVNIHGGFNNAATAAPKGYHWSNNVLEAHAVKEAIVVGATEEANGYTKHVCKCGEIISTDNYFYKESAKVRLGEDQYFRTLKDALDAADPGATITLLDIVIGEGLIIDKNVTIDFNGNSYVAKTAIGDTKAAIKINEGAKVTIKGSGVLDLLTANRENFGVLILNKGELTTDNIVLNGTWLYNGNESWVVKNEGNEATATFNAGTEILTSAEGNGNTVNAHNGFTNNAAVAAPKGYHWSDNVLEAHVEKETIVVGATENENTKGYTKHVCKCGAVISTDNYFSMAAAKVRLGEDLYFRTLKDALDAADSGATITLLDTVIGEGLTIDKNITINFNGYSYVAKTTVGNTIAAVMIKEGANVKLVGKGGLDVLTVNRANFGILILNEGTLETSGNVMLNGNYLYYQAEGQSAESWIVYNNTATASADFSGADVRFSWMGNCKETN